MPSVPSKTLRNLPPCRSAILRIIFGVGIFSHILLRYTKLFYGLHLTLSPAYFQLCDKHSLKGTDALHSLVGHSGISPQPNVAGKDKGAKAGYLGSLRPQPGHLGPGYHQPDISTPQVHTSPPQVGNATKHSYLISLRIPTTTTTLIGPRTPT